ncbi:hypothetical protein GCM10007049_24980 [Echinicola pacifica]|uniref:Toxin-antitoxin system YwqK family antitoxin n=1 Tax=Echinicola pacifica TaxID=346377 RepID=A0A918Q1Y1_9BACT|nr:toxin-antitoxin system YwqK family antitoxin [Echinicola pacifica]GGZ31027.1 hypothetical protein GCM10007049_24980 [Echinicola pacifica]
MVSKKSQITEKEGLTLKDGSKFTGLAYELFPESTDTVLVETYVNGLKEGKSKKWYHANQLMEVRNYLAGKKNGEQIAYYQNGNKRFHFTATDDAYDGEMKEWNESGNLIHLAHFKDGQEEGVQKLWYDNGKIRANYVIIEGKRYGLLGTKNCTNVSDSVFVAQ